MKLGLQRLIVLLLSLTSFSVVWAQRTYPSSKELPEDVVWMREIYRTLDLAKDTNGALYYPVEPQDGQMNLFTTLFRLLAQKKIPVYEYQLDGVERFRSDAQVSFRDVLDRFQIYYELKPSKSRRDSVISIHNSDVPSADVMSYFIKEVWYYDQRTSTFGSAVTALCPVLHRSEEFSDEKVKLPMFWVDYKDVAPYLAQSQVATSNYNNAAVGSWDDFFASRLYKGDIYKVTNLQNRTMAQYCPTDSAMQKEQLRIEKEIADFEQSLYGSDLQDEGVERDTLSSTSEPSVKEAKTIFKRKERATVRRRTTHAATSTVSSKSESTENASAPKASVRRQRR
ncbi:MAG: gliding motility protein GldN [Bacteroides sp.]|nr:gliding motility protein GldN [Bacteroides sp.]